MQNKYGLKFFRKAHGFLKELHSPFFHKILCINTLSDFFVMKMYVRIFSMISTHLIVLKYMDHIFWIVVCVSHGNAYLKIGT